MQNKVNWDVDENGQISYNFYSNVYKRINPIYNDVWKILKLDKNTRLTPEQLKYLCLKFVKKNGNWSGIDNTREKIKERLSVPTYKYNY